MSKGKCGLGKSILCLFSVWVLREVEREAERRISADSMNINESISGSFVGLNRRRLEKEPKSGCKMMTIIIIIVIVLTIVYFGRGSSLLFIILTNIIYKPMDLTKTEPN